MTDQYRPKAERVYGPIRDPVFTGVGAILDGLTMDQGGEEIRFDNSRGHFGPFGSHAAVGMLSYLDQAGDATTGSANEYGLLLSGYIPATGSAAGYQKNLLGAYLLVGEGLTGGVERDAVTADFQLWFQDGVADANGWVMHLQGDVGLSPFGGASGTLVIFEVQLINNSGVDDGRIDAIGADHAQVGFNMVAGQPGQIAPVPNTAAFVVSATNSDPTGMTPPYWHQAYYIATRGQSAIGGGAMDTGFEMQDMWAVFLGGKMSVGKVTRLDVADMMEIQPTGTNAMAWRWDQWGHMFTGPQATAPTQTLGTGATGGTGSVNTGVLAGSCDQSGRMQFKTGTAPVAGGTICTVTWANPFATAPRNVDVFPRNAIACADGNKYYVSNITATGFSIASPSSAALTFSQDYDIGWKVE